MQKPILKKLPNGVRLILIPLRDSLSVTAAVFVEAGSAFESKKKSGISHFLEHMLFKGTPRRPSALSISLELENLGAAYNAFTDYDLTGYHATVAPRNIDKAFDIIADMYLNPLLAERDMGKEKEVIIEELHMYEDDPRSKVSETLDALMYGDQPAGWSIAGTKDSVGALQRNDLVAYLRSHYVASKTIVAIAGNFDPDHAYADSKKFFLGTRTGAYIGRVPFKKHKSKHIAVAEKKLDQSHFIVGFNAVSLASEERFKISMMSKVLGGGMGSRLFQKIREEMGAAYYIGSSTNFSSNHGLVYIKGGINHAKLNDVFKAMLEEVRKIKEGITPEELVRAQEYTIGNFLLSLEGPDDQAMFYGYQMATVGKIQSPQDIVKKIRSVTIADVQKAAAKWLTKDNFHFALLGPYGKGEEKRFEELYRKSWA